LAALALFAWRRGLSLAVLIEAIQLEHMDLYRPTL